MSSLSQYRTSLAIFSLGLLWMVSEVVGDGEKPAPLDTATRSIVHRLKSADEKSGGQSDGDYELAVATSGAGSGGATEFAGAPGGSLVSHPASAVGTTQPASPQPDAVEEQPPGPDVGLIHK
uniref:hypothetical protein n=1 Tax=Altererythrobacter segetis TaxID=1104773 RepID=UPI0014086003|nr:hypothetical protein [Altererythrobacter segetis]